MRMWSEAFTKGLECFSDDVVVGQVADTLALPGDSQVLLTRGDRLNSPGGTSTIKIVSVKEARRTAGGD